MPKYRHRRFATTFWHAMFVALSNNKSGSLVWMGSEIISLESDCNCANSLSWWGANRWSVLYKAFEIRFSLRWSPRARCANNDPASSVFCISANVPAKCGCNLYIWLLLTHFRHYSLKSVTVVHNSRLALQVIIESNRVCVLSSGALVVGD